MEIRDMANGAAQPEVAMLAENCRVMHVGGADHTGPAATSARSAQVWNARQAAEQGDWALCADELEHNP
jgi:hypothetical protein